MTDEAILRMRRQLTAWLRRDAPDLERLVDWLQGSDLPDPDEDAYLWLLRGLPRGRDRYESSLGVASRLGAFLRTEPDAGLKADRPNQVLYNALSLAAGLDFPDQLAEPLREMLKRRKLTGSWLERNLRHVLRAALIRNQTDDALLRAWKAMLHGKRHAFLGGSRVDGFVGVVRCPSAGRGEPDLQEIGAAFAEMSRWLKPDRDRRLKFDDLLDRVTAAYPRPDWPRLFLEMANESQWEVWARERLPSMFVALGPAGSSDVLAYYVPYSVAYALQSLFGCELTKQYFGGRIRRVTIPRKALSFLAEIVPEYEQNRLRNPWGSEASVTEVDDYTLQVIESRLRARDRRLADAILRARAQLLQQKHVPVVIGVEQVA